jgi:hypothetical protein
VSGGEGDRLVEEEEWSPGPRLGKGMPPVSELEAARDPGAALVVADELSIIVHQTPAIASQGSSGRDGMEIPPGIDAVLKRHLGGEPAGDGFPDLGS